MKHVGEIIIKLEILPLRFVHIYEERVNRSLH